MDNDANNRRPQYTSVKHVSILKNVKDVSIGIVFRFGSFDGLMHVRIEDLTGGIDAFHAVACKRVPELFADQRDALAIFFVSRIVVRLERSIESIEDGNQIRDQSLDAAPPFFVAVALDPLPVIFKVSLPADERLKEIFFFRPELRDLRGEGRLLC
jgi:hypothetical protein